MARFKAHINVRFEARRVPRFRRDIDESIINYLR